MFNIVTDPAYAGGKWTHDAFYAHGRAEIDAAMARLDTLAVSHRTARALDFGCGVGRLTRALATRYKHVDGVDISGEMIRRANPHPHCTFHHNTAPDLRLFKKGMFDLVYSMIVLQHMPQDLQAEYVREFLRVVRPGAPAMFAVPEGPDVGHTGWWLSMYGTSPDTVEGWVADAGGIIVDVEDMGDQASWRNYRYTAVRA